MIWNRKYRKQRGMFGGATEQQMILAAAGIIVAIAAGAAFVVHQSSRGKAEWQLVDSLVGNIRELYQGVAYPAQDLSSDLISQQRVGNARTASGTTIYSNFGGVILPQGAGGAFTVTDPGVPQTQCVTMLRSIPATGYIQVAVNGASPITSFTNGIDVTTAKAQCSVTSSAGNSIVLTAQ